MEKKIVATEESKVKEVEIMGPASLINVAIEKGADLEKLEKLLLLKEKYEANEARKAYNRAMSDFKLSPPKIEKDQKGITERLARTKNPCAILEKLRN